MQEPDRKRFIIQIEAPGKTAVDPIKGKLEEIGFDLDQNYGPVKIDSKGTRWALRGWAGSEAKKKAGTIPGVKLFEDNKVSAA